MDGARLTLAHSYARNAAQETQKSNSKAATEQHTLAAGEFASARDTTHESEAIRILSLLEQHHRQLAQVLQIDSTQSKAAAQNEGKDDSSATADAPTAEKPEKNIPALARDSSSPTRLRRDAHRELSSSIANKMAVARGKPSAHRRIMPVTQNPLTPQIDRAIVTGERAGRPAGAVRQNSAPAASVAPKTFVPRRQQPTDDGFNRFFTSFDSLFSKLSAPLAFAGLPLTAQAAQEEASAAEKEQRLDQSRVRASDHEPDLGRIYSKAALRVIKEEGGPLGVQDSFYWVPPSGGTATYANMLGGAGDTTGGDGITKPQLVRQGSSGIPSTIGEEEFDQEFVDARESQGPPSPSRSRRGLRSRTTSGIGGLAPSKADERSTSGKTMEELELENTALRQLLDTQNRRLQMWEASSQAQSLALAQSIHAGRAIPALTPTTSDPTSTNPDTNTLSTTNPDSTNSRIQELETLLRVERAEREGLEHRNEKMARENEKLLGVLGKYREKWEQLKAGARRRGADGGGGSVKGGVGSPAGSVVGEGGRGR